MKELNSIITGTGSYVPDITVSNNDFRDNVFMDIDGNIVAGTHDEITGKFTAITGIYERRYAAEGMQASDLATLAAREAIINSGIDPESLDYLIVAHNFGDVIKHTIQSDMVPSIASRVKHNLGIVNPHCVGFDLLFGCPGWVQGLIVANSFIKSGVAGKCLVIGTETLSRVVDSHDRDTMIYADGAGACILEASSEVGKGIMAFSNVSFTSEESGYLYLGKSNSPDADPKIRYIKMNGRKLYEFALLHVPGAMKQALDKAGYGIQDLKKIFIHQANEKMDEEIVKRFYRLYGQRVIPEGMMPMNIHKLGNSSVATIPTLLDQVLRKTSEQEHEVNPGDVVLFASVGAGMNINAIAYRF
ncbi:MAG TPA: 3-oxoacyl-ACP synthase [Bacteroidales bacterium]|nr:MAG: 3-oxoacyl-ACP synthase [Bacteroidetes bacterium GWE2_42_24]OFY30094.1 MAG: 3-oxoacyl-ACP synthase [Bacteroidetes bacterium GWF2_43_11]PKP27495.1 MAG: 3-oxoacyl-ACP synthase [Bacteroidetes bacterium HGW-Bacteroidetes-22]HAQ64861.1 3-oxoacyl-ACP synthase [Bacteroidales bacterium]HBZ67901.1 3-oxoacyl-ACP synthase [Bacteroidales bacterium]